ncbi:MAG: RdgB/HAM1 family non-canonical purine NTP pyrophosphatase [Ignavibacteriaceae bacterium]|jgi:XTP/dITP diphosphohydrolase|nr:RdgB/HAM1 family non-canonical purine NTP pyrophosphatase [Ignavibacteriaceae bacterium]
MKLLFATTNNGKLKEVRKVFSETAFTILSLADFPPVPEIIEDGATFAENAKIKAKTIYDLFHVPTLADDSGLSVDQLNGEPGVFSARYAGENASDEANNKLLLKKLSNFPEPHYAKFVCSSVFYDGEKFIVAEDIMVGKIIHELRGVNGFGYDPLFIAEGFSVTNGELSLEEKNKISHRAKAFNRLKKIFW